LAIKLQRATRKGNEVERIVLAAKHFSHSHRLIFTTHEMTGADIVINPQHFGSDPADIPIRIRINPEIQIRISDYVV